jgi:hypothetical protein
VVGLIEVVGLIIEIEATRLLHAAVDWNSGELAFRLLKEPSPDYVG